MKKKRIFLLVICLVLIALAAAMMIFQKSSSEYVYYTEKEDALILAKDTLECAEKSLLEYIRDHKKIPEFGTNIVSIVNEYMPVLNMKDPWEMDVSFTEGYILVSAGADRQFNTVDDVVLQMSEAEINEWMDKPVKEKDYSWFPDGAEGSSGSESSNP